MIDRNAVIRDAHDLEPLPQSVARLSELLSEPDTDLSSIVECVEFDQGLTSRLLRVANSAVSGARSPIATVRGAVVRMGLGTVMSLAMASVVQRKMRVAVPEYELKEGEFWYHSVAAAVAAERMGDHCRSSLPAETFTAALLHDLGKLILSRYLDADVRRVLTMAVTDGELESYRAEYEVLGVHQGEIGGLAAQHWRLPEPIVKAIIYHHEPEQGGEPICHAVHLASTIAAAICGEQPDGPSEEEICPATFEALGLDPSRLPLLCADVRRRLAEVAAEYEVTTHAA